MEMKYCSEHGIPHEDFLSWDPASRAKVLAFLLEDGERCGLCGTAGWEWEENKRAYTPVEHLCMGCYLKEMIQEESGQTPGTTVRLVSSGSVGAAQRMVRMKREAARERQRDSRRERQT